MSFFPIYRYRLYDDPIERYLGDQLDCFDSWNDFVEPTPQATLVVLPNSLRWINQPQTERRAAQNKKPGSQKFRMQLNVSGFNPETISTKVENGKVIVEGKQEEREETGDFNVRHFRKSYPLPENADAEHLTSFVTPNHMLVIEIPVNQPKVEPQPKNDQTTLKQFGEHRDADFDYHEFLGSLDFQPKIVDGENNEKRLELSVEMKKYRPEEIKISVKNDELIVKGEHRHSDANHYQRSFFFKSTKLPPGTHVDQIQSFLTEDGHLKIQAPFTPVTVQPITQPTAQPTIQAEPTGQNNNSTDDNSKKDS